MSVVVSINILDKASPVLREIVARLKNLTPLNERVGKRVEVLLKKHFQELQGRGNKQGFPDKGFWHGRSGVAQHTQLTRADASGATITIADARFPIKLFGGTITPKRGKFLARPLRAEAYAASGAGRIRDVFPNLKFAVVPGIGPALVQAEASNIKVGRKRKDGSRGVKFTGQVGGLAFFQLIKSATMPAMPDALPQEDEIAGVGVRTTESYIERIRSGELKEATE